MGDVVPLLTWRQHAMLVRELSDLVMDLTAIAADQARAAQEARLACLRCQQIAAALAMHDRDRAA